MKILLILSLVCVSAYAAPRSQTKHVEHVKLKSLVDDLIEFLALIPLDKLKEISDEYLKNDKEFCDVIRYLQGDDWAALVKEVGSKPAVQDFEKYLTDAGIPVDLIIALIHELIQNADPQAVTLKPVRSLRSYLDEIEAALPIADLIALLNDKMENSADFQALYAEVSSEKAHALVEEVRALDEVQRLAAELRSMGVKVDEVLAVVYEFLGWGAPVKTVKSLVDDLLQFLALIPLDKLKEITDEYLKNDKEFCDVIRYLQGDDWAALVKEVGSKPAVQDFEKYLTDAGIPVDLIIALIHELIQNADPQAVTLKPVRSLRSYLDEIEAALPIADLIALLNDKMENSADFQALYAEVSSEKAHALVEEVRALDEVQRLAAELRSMGVKVDEVLAVVYEFLGWGAPVKTVKSLVDDLLQFLALIPLDKLKEITDEYLKNDKEFCDVIRYLQGDDWAALVKEVGSKPAVQDFEKYLTDAGIPVDLIIALIHELIQNADPQAVTLKPVRSLRSYLDEIEAALPIADLIALLNDKMENSADFQALYAEVSSEKAHALVEEVRALDEVQRLAAELRSMGVKVDEVLAIVYEFLGWGAPVKRV